jgi:hypothetical protein
MEREHEFIGNLLLIWVEIELRGKYWNVIQWDIDIPDPEPKKELDYLLTDEVPF